VEVAELDEAVVGGGAAVGVAVADAVQIGNVELGELAELLPAAAGDERDGVR